MVSVQSLLKKKSKPDETADIPLSPKFYTQRTNISNRSVNKSLTIPKERADKLILKVIDYIKADLVEVHNENKEM